MIGWRSELFHSLRKHNIEETSPATTVPSSTRVPQLDNLKTIKSRKEDSDRRIFAKVIQKKTKNLKYRREAPGINVIYRVCTATISVATTTFYSIGSKHYTKHSKEHEMERQIYLQAEGRCGAQRNRFGVKNKVLDRRLYHEGKKGATLRLLQDSCRVEKRNPVCISKVQLYRA